LIDRITKGSFASTLNWDKTKNKHVGRRQGLRKLPSLTKKLYIKSFGCQMNVYDSERMAEAIEPMGYRSVDGPEEADLIILNTCHIREKAAEKVYSELGRIKQVKEKRAKAGARTLIGVAGCVAQAEGAEMMRRAPVIDMVFGPQVYHRLPAMVRAAEAGKRNILDTEFPEEDKFDHLPPNRGSKTHTVRSAAAFVTIQEGCDKFCTFCVVPYTRGTEYSRPVDAIVKEAKGLIARGVREITLLGQNVNAYHGEGPGGQPETLAGLCRRLAELDGLERIRYTTSHPRDMDTALIEAHGNLPQLMPYLHLPVQSGSDRILAAMNRQHTAADYFELVDRIRSARPDIALSSDFIVGFPGETDEDFEATLALCHKVQYAQAYSFKYSSRPGTPGATLENQVDEAVKSERLARLQALLESQRRTFNEACLGSKIKVLLERKGRKEGQLIGRSAYLQSVHVSAPQSALGTSVTVEVKSIMPNSLGGILCDRVVEDTLVSDDLESAEHE
jgi:tRNA-2-methylthio-N6-dimethylallyladenosine synthase